MGVRIEMPTNVPMVLLRVPGSRQCVPIWIGAAEAAAIANALEGLVPPRPLTHDLFVDTLEALDRELTEVRILSLTEGMFLAELDLEGVRVSARPSDAIAIALRAGRPIRCSDEVIAAAAVDLPADEEPAAAAPNSDVVEEFREFLDHVNPDDFLNPGAGD